MKEEIEGGEESDLWLEGPHSGTWSESLGGSPFPKVFSNIVHITSLKIMWPQVYKTL